MIRVFATFGKIILSMNRQSQQHRFLLQAVLSLMLIILLVITLDLLTNRIEAVKDHAWDFVYYIDIAENGLIGNDHLAVPYAYRALTPLLARFINLSFNFSTGTGFKILAYIGVTAQLFGIYYLIRKLKMSFATALVTMLLPGFALFNTKFLLFDSYRPDLLAYSALVFGFICLLNRWVVPAVIIATVGVQMRETPGILAMIAIYQLILSWKTDRKKIIPLVYAAMIGCAMTLAVVLPRIFIPVKFTQQILDPIYDPNFLKVLFGMVLNWKRDINLVYNLAAYLLPLWLLATPGSLKRAWHDLGEMRAWFIIYLAVVFLMTLYGGTDMMRYVTYLFIPQAILAGRLVEQEKIPLEQILFTLIAVILFNRLFLPFPIWDFNAYLDFYGGYGDRLSTGSLLRMVELVGWIGLGILVRWILSPADWKASWKN